MRCWFVPKRSAAEIREAIKQGGKTFLEAVRPTSETIDELQKPMGDIWTSIIKPFNDYVMDQHGLDGLFNAITSRVSSPFKAVREAGLKDVEAAWARFSNEVVQAGGSAEKISKRIPNTPQEAVKQAMEYAREAAIRRFQNAGLQSGLLGPPRSGNHTPLPFDELKQSAFTTIGGKRVAVDYQLGILKQMQGKATQKFSAFAPREAPKDFMEKVGRGIQGAKHGIVGAIQWTPFFHYDTILGKFLPMVLGPRAIGKTMLWTVKLPGRAAHTVSDIATKGPFQFSADMLAAMRRASLKRNDPAEMERMARLGYFKIGRGGYEAEMVDKLTAAMRPHNKFATLGRSILAGYKDAMSFGVNGMGAVIHELAVEEMLARGISKDAAERAAARRATQIIGTLPKDMMSRGWRRFADFALLSMRYTTSTIMNVSRAFTDDHELASELRSMGTSPKDVAAAVRANREAFGKQLANDIALYWGVSNAINYAVTGLYNLPDKDGKKGAHFLWENPGFDWYDAWVNIKFVSGVDSATGQVKYSQVPMRTVRDQARIVMDPIAYMTGAGGITNPFQVEAYKGSPLVAVASMMYTGKDWRGKNLNMPTSPETIASYTGSLGELMQPVPIRDALVEGATYLSGGAYDKAVLKPIGDMISQMDPSNFVQRFGGIPASESDPLVRQLRFKQERFRNWLSMPNVQRLLKENDSTVVNAYWKYSSETVKSLDGRDIPIQTFSEAAADLKRIQSGQRPRVIQELEPQGETGAGP